VKPLVDGKAECSHTPEPHVVYDRRGWRATVYCKCRKISVHSKRLHGTLDGAEAAAKALLTMLKANAR
jgi:hypothetical protein